MIVSLNLPIQRFLFYLLIQEFFCIKIIFEIMLSQTTVVGSLLDIT
jgi:hypothetical protein